jgi:multidrug transporter EmrE-like cation transporter
MDVILQILSRMLSPGVDQRESLVFTATVVLAALLFTVGGVFMKLSEGLTRFWPTMIVFALFVCGAALQTLAMKREDLAVTYIVVVGLESILAFVFGVLLFSESCAPSRIAGVLLIAGGIISLRSVS